MNAPARSLLSAALSLYLASTCTLAQAGGAGGPGGGLYSSGILHQPLGNAPLFPTGVDRSVQFICFDNTLTQGAQIVCDSNGGAQCNVDMSPFLSNPGAAMRLRVNELESVLRNIGLLTCVASAGGSFDCTFDGTPGGASSVRVVVRDRFGNALSDTTCSSGQCSLTIHDNAAVGTNPVWSFSCQSSKLPNPPVATYDLKGGVKGRVMSGHATISGPGTGGIALPDAATFEFYPIYCITEPCPQGWGHIASMDIVAGTGGAPVALPVTVSNAGLASFSWGVSNPSFTTGTGVPDKHIVCWGIQDTQVGEVCDDGNTECGDGFRSLRVSNLGNGRSMSVDFDPDELDVSASRDSLHTLSSGRSVSFQVVPEASGIPIGTVRCSVFGRDSLDGSASLRYLLGLRGTALTCSSLTCATGGTIPVCRVYAVSATGAVLASGTATDTDQVTFTTNVPMPVITIDPTDQCIFDVSANGPVSCTMPSGQPVSGVARVVFSRSFSSSTVGVGAARVSFSSDDYSSVRVKGMVVSNPLYDGGLAFVPRKTSFQKPLGFSDRRIAMTNIPSADPTGEPTGGASLVYGTKNGVACDVDLDSVFNTPSATLKIRHKGWDGLIYGTHRLVGGGGGHGVLTSDYSDCPGTGVHWVLRDHTGVVLAEGDVAGPTLTCAIDTTCCGGPPPPGGEPQFTVETCCKGKWDLKENTKRTSSFTVTGLTPSPLTGVSEISLSRIVCITAPCPGDGTSTMAAMDIDVGGLPTLALAAPSWWVDSTPNVVGAARKGMYTWIKDSFDHKYSRAMEVCTGSGTCTSSTSALCLTDLGVTNVFTSRTDFTEAQSSVTCSCKSDCNADFLATGGGGENPKEDISFFGAARAPLTDGLLLMRFSLAPIHDSSNAALSFDGSGRGSAECLVECLSSAGAVLNARTVANFDVMQCVGMVSPSGHLAYIGTCDASGVCTVAPFATTGQCVIPGGPTVSNVAKIRCTPISPTYPPGPILSVTKAVQCEKNSDQSVVFNFSVAHTGGVPVTPVGAAVLSATTDGGVNADIGPTGTDGMELHFDTGAGGMFFLPIGDLLSAPAAGTPPRLRIRHKGWDGTIKGRTDLQALAGGGMTETYDVTGGPCYAVIIVGFSKEGQTLFSTTVQGTTVSWGVIAEGAASTMNKSYATSAMREAHEGFFDITGKRTVTVSGLTAAPVSGVHAITCTPLYTPGVVEPTQLASFVVTGSNLAHFNTLDGQRFRTQAGSNYPPPDRFASFLGAGAALVDERCASIYPCPWDTQNIVVSNLGSSGNDGVRLRAHFENGDIPDQTDFAVSGCGSWGETGGPPILGSASFNFSKMEVSYGSSREFHGHVTLIKMRINPSSASTPVSYAEDYYCDASGFGSPSTIVRVYSAAGALVDSAVVGPSDPITVAYCNTQQMPTFSNHGNECALQLPGIGEACYTVTIFGHPPHSAGKVTFNPFSITRTVDPINEVMFTGTGLQDIVIGTVQMEFPPACPADLGVQGGTPGQDNHLDNNDFVVFINFFFTGDLRADFGVQGGTPGHDGHLDNNDFVVFINDFFLGCP